MDVLMPQLGETVAEGKISKWFVKAGDNVKPGDNLFEIETDKVSMEVPAIASGTLSVINVQAGEIAPVGTVVAIIQGSGETLAPSKPQVPLTPAKARVQSPEKQEKKELDSRLRGNERSADQPPTPKSPIPMEPFREVRSPERNYGPARLPGGTAVTPLARRLAGEAGIDLTKLTGSGPHGRIVAADIAGAQPAKRAAPAFGQTAAQIVLTAHVAIGQALALCEQANAAQKTALELVDVIAKAWALALRHASLRDAGIVLRIGANELAVSDAANKPLTAIATMRNQTTADSAGASSAISIPDVPGIISVADVLRAPYTTVLSIGASRRMPIEATDGGLKFVDAVTATLTCDPGTLDAASSAALLSAFKGFVEQPVTMIV